MIKKLIFGLSFLALASATPTMAQVTIGSTQAPSSGALLDLKEKTDGTSDKGLGMPRVALSKLNPATPAELSASIGSTGNWDLAAHIGLIVYNTKAAVFDPATCKTEGAHIGLHVWDGSQWQGLGATATADPLESETATTLTDREGNTYAISTFGAAGIWMTENLRTKTAPGGLAMIESPIISFTDMHYAYPQAAGFPMPGQPVTWTPQEGLIYNWYATMNRNTCVTDNQGHGEVTEQTEVIQGICPFGWHVPSDREWNQLEEVFSASTTQYTNAAATTFAWTYSTVHTAYRPNSANVFGHGKSMKSTTPLNGNATNGDSKPAAAGGFNILLVGNAYNNPNGYGTTGHLWTSSSGSGTTSWRRLAGANTAGVYRDAISRSLLTSVRCKKNS